MGLSQGDADSTTAAARMRLLQQEFTTPRRTGDTGRRATTTEPAAPADLSVIDYMARQVREVIDHTLAAAPTASRPPAEFAAVYGWMTTHTDEFEDEKRQTARAIVYRQSLEHALKMGDESVVRRHPCPDCGCWGLFWRAAAREAACLNRHCAGEGPSRTFTLAQLAHQHIAAQETRRATRAT
ncbi:hypothetical protein AB0933_32605 [Streptomyces venezuelae]|uniref:hypothetical protein n=1 Tax=Streptomyces venezuelae TaxID=54571 RepID=UPI003453E753